MDITEAAGGIFTAVDKTFRDIEPRTVSLKFVSPVRIIRRL